MGIGRGLVTQDGGTSGFVLCSLWRKQGNVVTVQCSDFHRQYSWCFASRMGVKSSLEVCFGIGGGLEDEQVGGHRSATLSLDEGVLICGRNM
eukprot:1986119-Ditylum_brightwellii.AAC.1